MDTIRVMRVIEYVGPRDKVEKQVANSIHGTVCYDGCITISAATLGEYPEILETHDAQDEQSVSEEEKDQEEN